MNNKAFERFGKTLIEKARDASIAGWIDLIRKRGKVAWDPSKEDIQLISASLNDEQIEALCRLIPDIVDYTLFHLLLMFEEENDWIRISLKTEDEDISDMRVVADGDFQGYIFLWAKEYAKQPLGRY